MIFMPYHSKDTFIKSYSIINSSTHLISDFSISLTWLCWFCFSFFRGYYSWRVQEVESFDHHRLQGWWGKRYLGWWMLQMWRVWSFPKFNWKIWHIIGIRCGINRGVVILMRIYGQKFLVLSFIISVLRSWGRIRLKSLWTWGSVGWVLKNIPWSFTSCLITPQRFCPVWGK